jgi:hypothetical protein
MIKKIEKFSKNCPKCNKEMFYTLKSNLYRSCRSNSVCISCSHIELKNNIVRRNSDFFEVINTEEKSYWIGFMLADGCVRPKKTGYRVDINLAKIDYLHLKKMANIFGIEVKFYYSHNDQQDKLYYGCNLGFSDKKIWNDLNGKGVSHRKTYKNNSDKIFNFIPRKLMRHFIRGYFDGDGTVGWNKKIGISSCYFGFVSYTKGVLKKTKKYILEDIGIGNNDILGRKSKYILKWTGCVQLGFYLIICIKVQQFFLKEKEKDLKKYINILYLKEKLKIANIEESI